MLSSSEQLVCIPRNNTTSQSTPTPFYHAAKHLFWSIHVSLRFARGYRTIGSVKRNSWSRDSPCRRSLASKKFRMNVRAELGSDIGRNGSRKKGTSRAATHARSQYVDIVRHRRDISYLSTSVLSCIPSKAPGSPLAPRLCASRRLSIGALVEVAELLFAGPSWTWSASRHPSPSASRRSQPFRSLLVAIC